MWAGSHRVGETETILSSESEYDMSKAHTRSTQRGARKSGRTFAPDTQKLYNVSPPILTHGEKANFEFGEMRQDKFVKSFREFIRTCKKNGFSKPEDISKQLNKNGYKTACGNTWTRRLAWFLLSLLYNKEPANRPKRTQHTANPELSQSKKDKGKIQLSDEEVKKRIEAVRKNKAKRGV